MYSRGYGQMPSLVAPIDIDKMTKSVAGVVSTAMLPVGLTGIVLERAIDAGMNGLVVPLIEPFVGLMTPLMDIMIIPIGTLMGSMMSSPGITKLLESTAAVIAAPVAAATAPFAAAAAPTTNGATGIIPGTKIPYVK